jgi:anaerobic magnesium-protoporphyrin IX monomethyl ester cyclase
MGVRIPLDAPDFMQVLLTTLNAKYIHMNLAIRLLYGLNKHHQGLSWKEFAIKEEAAEIASACSRFDVIAFSCYIWNITQTLEVARIIKSLNPQAKILLGGPEVSYDWNDIIKLNEVDYIIVGEGEIPFAAFLNQNLSPIGISNLVYKDENSNITYIPSAESFDLKQLAVFNPYEFEPESDIKNKVAYIETSRGCPYKCEFCLASLDNKVRYLPHDTIEKNLLYLMQHGKVIKFLDRTFNIKKDFTIKIFEFILANHKPGNVFQFEITADIVHPDIIAFIKEKVPKGLFRFEIGIQTVNQKANLEVSRKQNFDKTRDIILQLRDDVEMHLDLIVGLPLDYFDDIVYSFEQVFALHAPELQLGFLKFLKGTPVRERYEQYGFIFDPNPPYQIIESNYLSKDELHSITLLEEALELYWNKGRAKNTLLYAENKVGIFQFLLNLGRWFSEKSNFHKHSLDDSFQLLNSFVLKDFPSDSVFTELIALDYYLHFKVKPKLQFISEPDLKVKSQVLKALSANQNKYRFIVVQLSFSFSQFLRDSTILNSSNFVCIAYTGTEKAFFYGEIESDLILKKELTT